MKIHSGTDIQYWAKVLGTKLNISGQCASQTPYKNKKYINKHQHYNKKTHP